MTAIHRPASYVSIISYGYSHFLTDESHLDYTFKDGKKILGQIDQEKDLTRDQKERQKASMQEVLRYCNNKVDCRRSQVLAFFNETFDAANCNQGCDVCLGRDRNVFRTEDVTEDAVTVIKMVQAFSNIKITILNAAECFRGYKGNSGKRLDQNPYFGAGQSWERNEGERLIQTLVIEGALEEYCVESKAGWTNAYLRVSRSLFLSHSFCFFFEYYKIICPLTSCNPGGQRGLQILEWYC